MLLDRQWCGRRLADEAAAHGVEGGERVDRVEGQLDVARAGDGAGQGGGDIADGGAACRQPERVDVEGDRLARRRVEDEPQVGRRALRLGQDDGEPEVDGPSHHRLDRTRRVPLQPAGQQLLDSRWTWR